MSHNMGLDSLKKGKLEDMRITVNTSLSIAFCVLAGYCRPFILSAAEPETHMVVEQEEIVGIVVRPDGETPIEKMPVRVWSVESQKITHRTRTDVNGIFHIPRQKVGQALIFVGRVKIDLRILIKDANMVGQHHDIVVVMPHRMLIASLPRAMEIPIGLMAIPPLISP